MAWYLVSIMVDVDTDESTPEQWNVVDMARMGFENDTDFVVMASVSPAQPAPGFERKED